MIITLGGSPVTIIPGTLQIVDSIGQRSVANFTVFDAGGSARYVNGTPVTIQDNTGLYIYAGIVTDSIRGSVSSYSAMLLHKVTCSDWHWLPDKRVVATSYANQTCGFMAQDIVNNWLAAEGVGTLNNLLSVNQSSVETDTTGFTALNSAVLTRDTTTFWQGAASLKCVTPGTVAFEGFYVGVLPSQVQASGIYTASVYIKGTVNGTVYLGMGTRSPVSNIGSAKTVTLTGSWQRVTVTAPFPASLTAATYDIYCYTNVTQAITFNVDGLQWEQAYVVTPWVVGLTSYVQPGPVVVSYVVNYKQASVALDDLAKLAGFYWYIDVAKVLHFAAQFTNLAPWTFDGTMALEGATVEDINYLYRNAQYMLGATEITAAQTETQKGDGSKRVFTTSFPIHSVPSNIHINAGAAQTIGILGIDTGKQWYWNKGIASVTQDSSGVVLATTDVLSVTYVGQYDVIALASDTAQQIAELAIEGAGTGIVENAVADASLVTAAQAFQSAAALLSKYATNGEILLFDTNKPGLLAGQLLTVNLPAQWQMSSTQVLIETITITFDDFQFWYNVKALFGPVNASWVQFFQAVANVQTPIDLLTQGGQQNTVAILAAFTMAWTWAINFSVVTQVCPVFPLTFTATLC